MILQLHTGPFGVNTYIIPLDGRSVCIIDPAACDYCGDTPVVRQYLAEHQLVPVAVILTHGHFDHVAGLPYLKSCFPSVPVCIHKADAPYIGARSAEAHSGILMGMGFGDFIPSVSNLPEPDCFLEDGKTLGECTGCDVPALREWRVMHTPGHTPGCCCLYSASRGELVSGDTVFYHSYGRTDLPGGNDDVMRQTLRKVYRSLPADTKVYPGHERSGFLLKENLSSADIF